MDEEMSDKYSFVQAPCRAVTGHGPYPIPSSWHAMVCTAVMDSWPPISASLTLARRATCATCDGLVHGLAASWSTACSASTNGPVTGQYPPTSAIA